MKKKIKNKEELLDEFINRMADPKEREYYKSLLTDLLANNVIPFDLLREIPVPARKAGKTRFDQLYDASIHIAFPKYRENTLKKLLGPSYVENLEIRVWRVLFPPKFKLKNVLIRATSYQEAFALGCDYACRLSLRVHHRIFPDLTIRVQFVSEKAVGRMLDIRWANRIKKRKQFQLVGREFTDKEISGATYVALGSPKNPEYSIVKYGDYKDLRAAQRCQAKIRTTAIEKETYNKD